MVNYTALENFDPNNPAYDDPTTDPIIALYKKHIEEMHKTHRSLFEFFQAKADVDDPSVPHLAMDLFVLETLHYQNEILLALLFEIRKNTAWGQ